MTVENIREAGFTWPPDDAVLRERAVGDGNGIDLEETRAVIASGRDYYRRQLDAAYSFKQSSGADYNDFTNDRDDHAAAHEAHVGAVKLVDAMLAVLDPDRLP